MKDKTPVGGVTGSPEHRSGFAAKSLTRFLGTCLAAGLIGSLLTSGLGLLMGARNNSGVYSLPSGNPVVAGTTIQPSWANNTLSDISTEITNSLDRAGRGAMTAPLQCSSGTAANPSLTFSAGPTDGWYRVGAHDVGMSINGAQIADWQSTGLQLLLTGASGGTPFKALDSSLTAGNGMQMELGAAESNNNTGVFVYASNATAANSTMCMDVFGQANELCVDGNGKTYVGSGSTGIANTYGNTYNFAAGTIAAGTCSATAQTLTGVSTGGVCNVSPDGELGGGSHVAVTPYCWVTGANAISIVVCNGSGSSFTSNAGNYRVRVWQP